MSIVTNKAYQPQLRCLPLRGRNAAYCYELNLPGCRAEVNHSFAEWTVGDFINRMESNQCENLTDGSPISVASPSESSDGSLKATELFTCVQATNTASALPLSTSSSVTFER